MNSIKQIEVLLADRLVGRLALTKEGLCAFEYAPDWLGSGFSISPFELPLRSGVFLCWIASHWSGRRDVALWSSVRIIVS